MFVDRESELDHLNKLYESRRAELFVLYGRRRVGKTELLHAFCKEKPNIFFVATLSADLDQLASFSAAIWQFNHPADSEGPAYRTWEAAFSGLADLPGRPIIVLDEFTYLISGNKAIPSILQKVWDEKLRHTNIFMVLCGSYVGMMEKEVLGYQAPLYGRRTGSYLLPPLELPTTTAFFPVYTPVQRIEAWSVLGGMPYYLQTFSDLVDAFANIRAHVLDTKGTLYNEPLLLLMEELREPRNYFSVLRAIAQGRTRLNEIAQSARIGDSRTTARYLDLLQQMRVITRTVPATESRPDKSKKGLYQISDHFLRFWFRYVHPHRNSLELNLADAVLEQRVKPDFDHYASYSFEAAARQWIARLARRGELPFLPERIGAWWGQGEEIDVVAVSDAERAILVGECKWTTKQVGSSILVDLKRKTQVLVRETDWTPTAHFLFAKSGFTPELRLAAASEDVRLVEPAELVAQ